MTTQGKFVPKTAEETLKELRQARDKRREEERAAIRQARATSGREPFDIEKFKGLYDVSLDVGSRALGPGDVEDYERKYYLAAPAEVKTLQQFAEHLMWLFKNDAG
ncbi:hypothetical protein JGU66_03225 [Myxococcaceae bacterium JPH2]|nr:hypothetical protein [Myxococcaceae bacterium JPH2]